MSASNALRLVAKLFPQIEQDQEAQQQQLQGVTDERDRLLKAVERHQNTIDEMQETISDLRWLGQRKDARNNQTLEALDKEVQARCRAESKLLLAQDYAKAAVEEAERNAADRIEEANCRATTAEQERDDYAWLVVHLMCLLYAAWEKDAKNELERAGLQYLCETLQERLKERGEL